MTPAEAIYFRDQLRSARASAVEDAEGFQSVLHSLESIGVHLSDRVENMDRYRDRIATIAASSPLADGLGADNRCWHMSFVSLYESLRLSRNDAVHQGAYARSLTSHAVELALILEDALMNDATQVSHFMVRDPVCAEEWQPVSFARQQMLVHSFSYLPFFDHESRLWKLLSEYAVASYLRRTLSREERKRRLATPVATAIKAGDLPLLVAQTVRAEAELDTALGLLKGYPILVTRADGPNRLVGMLTASDIL